MQSFLFRSVNLKITNNKVPTTSYSYIHLFIYISHYVLYYNQYNLFNIELS